MDLSHSENNGNRVSWIYVYYSPGWLPIGLSLAWIVAGACAFGIWARIEHVWPFGPKEIREEYVEKAAAAD